MKHAVAFLILTLLVSLSCQQEHDPAVKNTYSISVQLPGEVFGPESQYIFYLFKNDQLVETGSGTAHTFIDLEEGQHYTVIPQPLDPSKNGLSSLDVVWIEQFINGEIQLSPIGQLAADVNLDNVIDLEDIDIVRNCIISNDNCPAWRFFTADYDGAGTGSVDKADFPQLFGNQEVSFSVIKLGDINCTLCPG